MTLFTLHRVCAAPRWAQFTHNQTGLASQSKDLLSFGNSVPEELKLVQTARFSTTCVQQRGNDQMYIFPKLLMMRGTALSLETTFYQVLIFTEEIKRNVIHLCFTTTFQKLSFFRVP